MPGKHDALMLAQATRPENRSHPSILAWLTSPATGRGIHVLQPGGEWVFWSYRDLAHLVSQTADGLAELGIRRGGRVAILQRPGADFVATFFGTMLAGGACVPAAPPMAFQHPASYRDHLTRLLRTARPRVIVADHSILDQVRAAAGSAGTGLVIPGDDIRGGLPGGEPVHEGLIPDLPGEPALLQFTSGSSGAARAVPVTHGALASNVAAIRRWLRWTADDPVASWLPLYHDMGLIGCFITSVVSQSDFWLLPPEEFIHRPIEYVRCFGELGARLTAMPNFGLDYIAKRVRAEDIERMDFSRWRAVIVGAEYLNDVSFERFHALLGPRGFRRTAMRPAYGLAEATLAVTGLPLAEEWTSVAVEPTSVAVNRPIIRTASDGGQVIVGSGRPLSRISVSVVDEEGKELPGSWVGEIVVRGPSVAAGYAGGTQSATRFADGAVYTGDAGFIADGQLFVLGRLGDALKIRGRSVFAEDLEVALGNAGVPRHRTAVALGLRNGTPTAVVVFERPQPAWLDEARALLGRRAEGADVAIVDLGSGTIPRTSSGKVRRRQIWLAFAGGSLPGRVAGNPR